MRLGGRRAQHLRDVLRVEVGAALRVGVLRGALGRGVVVACGAEEIVLSVTLDGPTSPTPTLDLVLAVPRPKALSRVLQSVASLGVRRLDLVNAWRVDKSYFSSERLAPERLEADLLLGCEQGATTFVPEVRVHRLFRELVEEALPQRLAADGARGLLAHPHAASPIEAGLRPGVTAPLVLAVGPDGGFIEPELASFERSGFTRVALMPSILRVEVAVAALLAQVALLRRLS